ncbi:DUF4276 family protein [Paraburkholderia fungorum]|uniref:DUF4276 family protein n=1 Tax=Paraburkholderia fungorum TaxID=134537 RepID=UPI0004A9F402|nr:DUF4276 family protein [Paraburkholderia fungorum]KFX61029.1 hypothetical protein KBK24_0134625 [Burkholderia sp. K24]USX10505.1 DUF4276 family protein [Paraburkholderia fungorum]
MRSIAIFVEGLTEQEFVVKLLSAVAGRKGITFEIKRQHRGLLELTELRPHMAPDFYVLVVNCCNDGQVKSQIKDQYNSLKAAGYSLVVGLRDVYPLTAADIPKLNANMYTGLAVDTLPIALHLAILEVEAWFIEESTHFTKIDPAISADILKANGFHPGVDLACDLPHPAETLDAIYSTVGKRYAKKANQIQRTVEALSYEELYVNVRQRAASFHEFLNTLEASMFPQPSIA